MALQITTVPMKENRQWSFSPMPFLFGRWVRIALLFLLFFVAMNALDYRSMLSLEMTYGLYTHRGSMAKAAFYLASYAACIGTIVVLIFSESTLIRNLTFLVGAILLSLEFIGQLVYGKSPGCNEAMILLEETAFAGEAMAAYLPDVLHGIVKACIVVLVLMTVLCLVRIRFNRKWLVLVPISLSMAYAGIWKTAGIFETYPSPIKIPLVIVYSLLNSVYSGPRDQVELRPTYSQKLHPRHVIYIVDESVRGDFLGINGCPINTTPYLCQYSNLVNFGIACSATNHSAGTNIILQAGTRPDQLPDTTQVSLRNPSIFQYAKAAGYTTYYLDGQGKGMRRHNFMTKDDLTYIDEFYQAFEHNPTKAPCENDYLIAKKIRDIVATNTQVFIYVNKYGAHTCYENCYPADKSIFSPELFNDQSQAAAAKDKLVNTYAHAIRWSVDGFFEQLLPSLKLKDTFLVYTSDHGQSLGEGGVKASHGVSSNPPSFQANVPLFVIGECWRNRVSTKDKDLINTRSHFHVFPTLLCLMGYDEREITRRYGVPLWNNEKVEQKFLSGDVFGRAPASMNAFKTETKQ